MKVGVWTIWVEDRLHGDVWVVTVRRSFRVDGVAGVVGWEAWLGWSMLGGGRKMGLAIVKGLQFLIPNRRAWWTGGDTPEWGAHPSWEEEAGAGVREREGRCKISDGVTSEWGRGKIDSPYKARDVGVKGQRVLWEGIAGLRLLHVSLLGLQGSRGLEMSSAFSDCARHWIIPRIIAAFVFRRTPMQSSSHLASEFATAYNEAWKAQTLLKHVASVFLTAFWHWRLWLTNEAEATFYSLVSLCLRNN